MQCFVAVQLFCDVMSSDLGPPTSRHFPVRFPPFRFAGHAMAKTGVGDSVPTSTPRSPQWLTMAALTGHFLRCRENALISQHSLSAFGIVRAPVSLTAVGRSSPEFYTHGMSLPFTEAVSRLSDELEKNRLGGGHGYLWKRDTQLRSSARVATKGRLDGPLKRRQPAERQTGQTGSVIPPHPPFVYLSSLFLVNPQMSSSDCIEFLGDA